MTSLGRLITNRDGFRGVSTGGRITRDDGLRDSTWTSSVFNLLENIILLTLNEDLLTVSVSDVTGRSETCEVLGVAFSGTLSLAGPHLTFRTLAFNVLSSSGGASITASFVPPFCISFFTVFFCCGFTTGSKLINLLDPFSKSLLSIWMLAFSLYLGQCLFVFI
ncbi:hypothetical protein HanLR1_Chr06g0202651 [Helianthus annuus]|nr:hypothetical protein HanHA89_Chr06g0217531 [Helianthus annuus]KAJ0737051.1 hypothetical protein HanLR1_Chr06g0202651 [Helianthus annuus]